MINIILYSPMAFISCFVCVSYVCEQRKCASKHAARAARFVSLADIYDIYANCFLTLF